MKYVLYIENVLYICNTEKEIKVLRIITNNTNIMKTKAQFELRDSFITTCQSKVYNLSCLIYLKIYPYKMFRQIFNKLITF